MKKKNKTTLVPSAPCSTALSASPSPPDLPANSFKLPYHPKPQANTHRNEASNQTQITQNTSIKFKSKRKQEKQEQRRKDNLKRDIVSEFDSYFGGDTKLANWKRLCADIGIEEELTSLNRCRQALKDVWVNIYDLVDAVKAGECPRRFPSEKALSSYTRSTGRVYPKNKVKKGGPVRLLLAHIFS